MIKKQEIVRKNGITLVSLVITVIILLILAGVSIIALMQTGLFEYAKKAKKAMDNAQKEESLILGDYENQILNISNANREIEKSSSIITEVKFEVLSITSTDLKIKIIPTASDESDILGYHIIAIKESENDNAVSRMTTEKEIELNQLEKNCEYNVFVAAYDKFNNVRYSEIKKIQTLQEFDFISKFKSNITINTEGEYYGLSGKIANFEVNGNSYFESKLPCLTISDTNSYANFYTSNKLEQNFKSIEIHVRTRNDGKNDALLKVGLVSNTGDNPTWVENATNSLTCANTSNWTDYKTIITIPKEVNAKDCYLQMYFKHNGTGYSMAMEFITLKGVY